MKEHVILFIMLGGLFAIVPTLAQFYGLDMKVDNPNCPEEVNGVKKNKLALKILYGISIVMFIIAVILTCI